MVNMDEFQIMATKVDIRKHSHSVLQVCPRNAISSISKIDYHNRDVINIDTKLFSFIVTKILFTIATKTLP